MCLMGGKAFHITFFKLLYIFLYFLKLNFHPLILMGDFNQIAQHWLQEKESIKTESVSGLLLAMYIMISRTVHDLWEAWL